MDTRDPTLRTSIAIADIRIKCNAILKLRKAITNITDIALMEKYTTLIIVDLG